LTYGVIKYGYALEGSWNGFKISLRPAWLIQGYLILGQAGEV
jgi:hypothetical protein